jgi:hypothetical protein
MLRHVMWQDMDMLATASSTTAFQHLQKTAGMAELTYQQRVYAARRVSKHHVKRKKAQFEGKGQAARSGYLVLWCLYGLGE